MFVMNGTHEVYEYIFSTLTKSTKVTKIGKAISRINVGIGGV